MLSIKKLTQQDYPRKEIEAVILEAFSTTPDADIEEWYSFPEMHASIVKTSSISFIALKDNQLVGFIHAQPESPIYGQEGLAKMLLTNIGVIPEFQRQGIGGKLLEAVETEARRNGAEKIIVHTNPDDRKAVGFYLKYKYTPAGIVDNYYYRGPAQFFVKRITSPSQKTG